MELEVLHELGVAGAALADVHARMGDFIAQILDALTAEAAHHPDRLRQVVLMRTEAAELVGQGDDAIDDLRRALVALKAEGVS
jgi:hypothetical protein